MTREEAYNMTKGMTRDEVYHAICGLVKKAIEMKDYSIIDDASSICFSFDTQIERGERRDLYIELYEGEDAILVDDEGFTIEGIF